MQVRRWLTFGPGRWVEDGYEPVFGHELSVRQPGGFTRAEGAFGGALEVCSLLLFVGCWESVASARGRLQSLKLGGGRHSYIPKSCRRSAEVDKTGRGVRGGYWPHGVSTTLSPSKRRSPAWRWTDLRALQHRAARCICGCEWRRRGGIQPRL